MLEIVGACALALLVLATLTITTATTWMYRGGFLLVACGSAIVIAAAVSPSSARLRAALGTKPLVFIGLISYGLYLFHMPIYGFYNAQNTITDPATLFVLRYASVLAVATASYYFIERPIRRGALSGRKMLVALPAAIATTIAVLLVGTSGGVTPVTSSFARMAEQTPRGAVRVLVAGDTIAATLGNSNPSFNGNGIYGAVVSLRGCDGINGKIVVNSKAYVTGNCTLAGLAYAKTVSEFRPYAVVLMIGPLLVFDHVVQGRRLRVGTPAFESYIDTRLDKLRSILGSAGAGKFILTTVPCMTPSTTGNLRAFAVGQRDRRRVAWVNRVFRRYSDAHHEVTLADFGSWLCASPRTNARTYRDQSGVGMSPTGAVATWRWLATSARP